MNATYWALISIMIILCVGSIGYIIFAYSNSKRIKRQVNEGTWISPRVKKEIKKLKAEGKDFSHLLKNTNETTISNLEKSFNESPLEEGKVVNDQTTSNKSSELNQKFDDWEMGNEYEKK